MVYITIHSHETVKKKNSFLFSWVRCLSNLSVFFPCMFTLKFFSTQISLYRLIFLVLHYFNSLTLCVLEVHSQCGSENDVPELTLSWLEHSLIRTRWLAVAVNTETALLLWRDTVRMLQPFTLQGQKNAFSHPHFHSSLPPSGYRLPVLVLHGGVDSCYFFTKIARKQGSVQADTHICTSENE